jgi:hypothetical protein
MIVKNPDQRVAVLVDVQNLYYSAKNLYHSRVNFKNLLSLVVHKRILVRAISYVIKADPNEKENEFFDALNNAGFEVKEKNLQIFFGGAKKGDWDLNHDNACNTFDLFIVLDTYGEQGPGLVGDLNNDNKVNALDYTLITSQISLL